MNEVNEILAILESKTAGLEAFDRKIQLDLDGNIILIDGTTTPPSIVVGSHGEGVDVSATSTVDVFSKVINRKMNVQLAMMSGKIKIKGDMLAAVPLMKML